MSLKAAKKVDTNRYEIEITIDGEKFQEAIKTVYLRERENITITGFRKGKAPLALIEKKYGEGVFYEDALNLLYSDALEAAAEEAGLTIIDDEMKFDLVSINKNDGVDFKVTLTVKPEIEVANYKGIKAEKLISKVSASEVKTELERMAERNSRMVEVTDRAAEIGDTAVIDFEGFVDGVAFDGGKGEGHSLALGSGQFIPGFEDQIVGHNNGEEFDVNVTFPEEYGAKELAGKAAVFKVKLHEIKRKELPVIDDEFAKDVSEFDTLDELKADIKAKALENKEKSANDAVEGQLVEELVAGVKGEIPEAMFRNAVEQNLKDFDYRLQMQGMNLETYMQFSGGNLDDLKKTMRPQAERNVKLRLALEKIVELEKIVPTTEEIEKEFSVLSETYNMEVAQIKAAISEKDIAADIAVRKAMDIVKETAEVTDVKEYTKKEEAKEPAAKKTSTAKKTTSTTKKTTTAKTAKTQTKEEK